MFLLWLRQLPWCGGQNPASGPPPAEGRPSPANTPVSPPTSFTLPSFAWFYIFFSSAQFLLSQLVFCMHFCVWRNIPDVSVERDVFHIHLFLHHVVHPFTFLLTSMSLSTPISCFIYFSVCVYIHIYIYIYIYIYTIFFVCPLTLVFCYNFFNAIFHFCVQAFVYIALRISTTLIFIPSQR